MRQFAEFKSPLNLNSLSGSYTLWYLESEFRSSGSACLKSDSSTSRVEYKQMVSTCSHLWWGLSSLDWRESDYQKPLAIMKCRMVLLYHCRLRIPLNIPTRHYSNGFLKLCPMLYSQPSNPSCAACKRMPTYEKMEGREHTQPQHSPKAHIPPPPPLPKLTSPLLLFVEAHQQRLG